MKKRRYSITASEQDIVPVVASYFKGKKGTLPKNTHLSMLACDNCNTQVLGSHSVNPFCICCASDMHSTTEDNLAVSAENLKKDFEEIAQCQECDTFIAVQKDIVASFDDDAFYCPTCTASINLKADDDDEEDSDTEDTDSDTSSDSDSDSDMSDTVDENTDSDSDTDSSLFDNDSGEGGDDSGDTTSDTSSDSDNGDTSSDSDSDTSSDSSNDTSSDDTSSAGGDSSLTANLVQMVSGKEGDLAVVASPDKSKWFLFFNNMPIASSSKDNASDNIKSIFDTDKFYTAWNAAIADGVSEDTLNDFGFTATTTDVPVDEAVKQNLEASINEFKAKNTMTAQDVRNRYERCVGIAAVGINKQVFKENNPILKSLVASFGPTRVRNAERMILKAFEEHGEEYLGNIAEKASELMDKSDETLDELAKTVDDARYSKIEDNANSNQQPKIAPFPKAADPKIDDKKEDSRTELAASDDDDADSRVQRMFSGMRHRHG